MQVLQVQSQDSYPELIDIHTALARAYAEESSVLSSLGHFEQAYSLWKKTQIDSRLGVQLMSEIEQMRAHIERLQVSKSGDEGTFPSDWIDCKAAISAPDHLEDNGHIYSVPHRGEAYVKLARECSRHGANVSALGHVEEAIECVREGNSVSQESLVDLYNGAATICIRSHEWERALQMLHEARRCIGHSKDALVEHYAAIAGVYMHQKDADRALGTMLSLYSSKFPESTDELVQQDGVSPKQLGFAFMRLKDYSNAILGYCWRQSYTPALETPICSVH